MLLITLFFPTGNPPSISLALPFFWLRTDKHRFHHQLLHILHHTALPRRPLWFCASGYDTEHGHSISLVDHGKTCSVCNLSCWSAVWSWPLCCSSVSGWWHSYYSLGYLYVDQQFMFSDPQRVLPVELPVTSMKEYESDNTKFNTPAPHSHLRPCNTNKSHDTLEGKWLIGSKFWHFHLGVYSLLLPVV